MRAQRWLARAEPAAAALLQTRPVRPSAHRWQHWLLLPTPKLEAPPHPTPNLPTPAPTPPGRSVGSASTWSLERISALAEEAARAFYHNLQELGVVTDGFAGAARGLPDSTLLTLHLDLVRGYPTQLITVGWGWGGVGVGVDGWRWGPGPGAERAGGRPGGGGPRSRAGPGRAWLCLGRRLSRPPHAAVWPSAQRTQRRRIQGSCALGTQGRPSS